MQKVFVSYAHEDSDMADRIVADLRESEVPATYDKWLLRVGDSIIEKIASAVSDSDIIIALLSRASVESTWVKKELALAMTGEIVEGRVKVLPAKLDKCDIPPMLADKFHASFDWGYWEGLRQLLEAICPSLYEREAFVRREAYEDAENRFRLLLDRGDLDAIKGFLADKGFVLAALLGRWSVSEGVPRFKIGNQIADFIVINGQSFRYELSLVTFDSPAWSTSNRDKLLQEVQRSQALLKWCRENEDAVRRSLALRMPSSYGAEQIAPTRERSFHHGHSLPFDIVAKILCGRRSEFRKEDDDFRNKIYEESNHIVEVVSYDRLLDVIRKLR